MTRKSEEFPWVRPTQRRRRRNVRRIHSLKHPIVSEITSTTDREPGRPRKSNETLPVFKLVPPPRPPTPRCSVNNLFVQKLRVESYEHHLLFFWSSIRSKNHLWSVLTGETVSGMSMDSSAGDCGSCDLWRRPDVTFWFRASKRTEAQNVCETHELRWASCL